jgi:hypothetical protein
MWVLNFIKHHPFSALTYPQETKAKAYQSTAAAAAMENAVQQTSKFVLIASRFVELTHLIVSACSTLCHSPLLSLTLHGDSTLKISCPSPYLVLLLS